MLKLCARKRRLEMDVRGHAAERADDGLGDSRVCEHAIHERREGILLNRPFDRSSYRGPDKGGRLIDCRCLRLETPESPSRSDQREPAEIAVDAGTRTDAMDHGRRAESLEDDSVVAPPEPEQPAVP